MLFAPKDTMLIVVSYAPNARRDVQNVSMPSYALVASKDFSLIQELLFVPRSEEFPYRI